jgi:hypothetical protein
MGCQTLSLTIVPTEHKAGWAPELVRTFWKREKPLHPTGIWIKNYPACSLVAVVTAIPQLPILAVSINISIQVCSTLCLTYSDLWEQIRCVGLSVGWSSHQYSWHAYSRGGTRWSGRWVVLVHSMTARWMNEWHEELLHSVACLALKTQTMLPITSGLSHEHQ